MQFDVMNALLFKVLADKRDIQDSNKIVMVAGITTGSPMMKMLIPFTMIQQAEEITESDEKLETVHTSVDKIRKAVDEDGTPEVKVDRVKQALQDPSLAHLN